MRRVIVSLVLLGSLSVIGCGPEFGPHHVAEGRVIRNPAKVYRGDPAFSIEPLTVRLSEPLVPVEVHQDLEPEWLEPSWPIEPEVSAQAMASAPTSGFLGLPQGPAGFGQSCELDPSMLHSRPLMSEIVPANGRY